MIFVILRDTYVIISQIFPVIQENKGGCSICWNYIIFRTYASSFTREAENAAMQVTVSLCFLDTGTRVLYRTRFSIKISFFKVPQLTNPGEALESLGHCPLGVGGVGACLVMCKILTPPKEGLHTHKKQKNAHPKIKGLWRVSHNIPSYSQIQKSVAHSPASKIFTPSNF